MSFFTLVGFGQNVIYQHDFETKTPGQSYTGTPTIISPQLSNQIWTTSFSGGFTFPNNGKNKGVLNIEDSSGAPTITLTLTVAEGHILNLSSLSFNKERGDDGAKNWSVSINGNSNIANGTVGTDLTTTGQIQVDTNNITGTFTIVLSLSGGNSNGNKNKKFFSLDKFIINGTITNADDTLVYNTEGWTPYEPNANTGDKNVFIASGVYSASTDIKVKNLIIASQGAGIIVTRTGSIIVNENLITANSLTLRSGSENYSSLIVYGTVTGTAKYLRHVNVNTAGNDLISAPVTGQLFTDFILENGNIYSTADESLFLFGPFNKNTGEYVFWGNSTVAPLQPAIGYRAASDNNSTLIFNGKVNTNMITTPIVYSGPKFMEWNLVGNPYPSYIDGAQFLQTNLNLLNPNAAAIYGYDGNASDGWSVLTIANMGTPGYPLYMTPGQGFLLATKTAGGDVVFNPTMRTVAHNDDYISGKPAQQNRAHAVLQVSNGADLYKTGIYFNESSTKVMDAGYDATVYGGKAPTFSIYSHLVDNASGLDLAVQSLAYADLSSNLSIPLGINAKKGQQITVSLDDILIPNGIEVYLEDKVAKTFTKLTDSDYTFSVNSNMTGSGRFFINFRGTTSDLDTAVPTDLQMYTTSKTVFIKGILNEATTVSVYDFQGRVIKTMQLEENSSTNQIDLTPVTSGLYIIKLKNNTQEKTQKIILK